MIRSFKSIWQNFLGAKNKGEKLENIPRDERVWQSSEGPLAESKFKKYSEMKMFSQLFDQVWQLIERKEFARIYKQCYLGLKQLFPDQHFEFRIEQIIIEHAKFLFDTQTSEEALQSLYSELNQFIKFGQIDVRTSEFLKCILEKKSAFSSISLVFNHWLQQKAPHQTPLIITHLQEIPEKWLFPFPEDIKKLFGAVNQKICQPEQEKIEIEVPARQQFQNLLSKFCPKREGRFAKEDSFERLSKELKEGIEEFVGEKVETIRKLEEKLETNNMKAMGLIEKYGRECEKRDIQIFQQKEEKNDWEQWLDTLFTSLLHHDDKLKSLNETFLRTAQVLQQQKGQLQNEINQASHKLQQIQIEHKQSVEKMREQYSAIVDKLKRDNQNLKDTIKAQIDDIQRLTRERSEIQDQYNESTQQLNFIQSQHNQSTGELNYIQDQYNQSTRQLQLFKDKYNESTRELSMLKDKYNASTRELSMLKDKYNESTRELSMLKDNYNESTQELGVLKNKYNESTRKQCQIRGRYQELELKFKGYHPTDKLFSHQILLKQPEHKKFLADALKDRYGSKVSHTMLLCHMDPYNNTNFHKYFDNIPCIMAIVRLENEMLVAGFSLSPFVRGSKGEDSLLFSITNRKVFYLRNNQKSIEYNDTYLMFGSSDLRIRVKENYAEAYSHFGLNSSSFQNEGNKVDILFGMGQKQNTASIVSYEIFQVMFENDLHLKYSVK